MKISFDYDGTLSTDRMQKIAKKMIDMGNDVYITTNRGFKEDNTDLFHDAGKIGISKDHIQLTDNKGKDKFLKDFDLHFDDSMDNIELIESNTDCNCIYVNEISL